MEYVYESLASDGTNRIINVDSVHLAKHLV